MTYAFWLAILALLWYAAGRLYAQRAVRQTLDNELVCVQCGCSWDRTFMMPFGDSNASICRPCARLRGAG